MAYGFARVFLVNEILISLRPLPVRAYLGPRLVSIDPSSIDIHVGVAGLFGHDLELCCGTFAAEP